MCRTKATQCARRAQDAAAVSDVRQQYLELERQWLELAADAELVERLQCWMPSSGIKLG
jgi:hypothetical protein